MKRTKSMVYNQTQESIELYTFADNDGNLYRTRIQPCIDNLMRKYEKGIYDHDKAVDLFYYVMNDASAMYNRLYGYSFSVADRFTAAVDMEKEIYDDYITYHCNH